MKNKKITVKNLVSLDKVRTKITNALTEDGTALKEALMDFISEIENSEAEIGEDELRGKITEYLSSMTEEEVPEVIANAIAKATKTIQNSVKAELPTKVKNELAAAIMRSSKKDIQNAVQEVLVKNSITGLDFADAIDFAIVTGWEKLNPLFEMLHKTMFSKFFYTDADMDTAAAIAKGWNKANAYDKLIQALEVDGKQILTKYVYKRQQMALEDLDEIEAAGQASYFENWINTELDTMIANSIIMAILVGDTVNAAATDRITTFETIGNKAHSDLFTTVTVEAHPTVANYRSVVDTVKNPNGAKKVAIMSQDTLTDIAEFIYGTGGTIHYRSKEEVAGQLGVDEIYVTDILEVNATVKMIVLIPDEYWVREKKALEVAFPTYEKNAMNFMKERNIGGAIHGMFSTAVLRTA